MYDNLPVPKWSHQSSPVTHEPRKLIWKLFMAFSLFPCPSSYLWRLWSSSCFINNRKCMKWEATTLSLIDSQDRKKLGPWCIAEQIGQLWEPLVSRFFIKLTMIVLWFKPVALKARYLDKHQHHPYQLLEMQIFGHYLRPTEWETLRMGPSICALTQFWSKLSLKLLSSAIVSCVFCYFLPFKAFLINTSNCVKAQ